MAFISFMTERNVYADNPTHVCARYDSAGNLIWEYDSINNAINAAGSNSIVYNAGTFIMNGGTLSENHATNGGGAYYLTGSVDAKGTVTFLNFIVNEATSITVFQLI